MNKLLTNTLLLGALSLGSISVFANEKGNGGDAVVCGDQVFMLDYVEENGLDTSLEVTGTIDEILESKLIPFKNRDPLFFKYLDKYINRFLPGIIEYELTGETDVTNIEFTEDQISDFRDERFYKIPQGCNIRQLIIRRDMDEFIDKEFIVQQTLWNQMSNFQKAVAVIHEAVYIYMHSLGEKNSFKTRRFNRLIFSDKASNMNDLEYINIMVKFNLKHYFEKGGVIFYPGALKSCLATVNRKKMICSLNEDGNFSEISISGREQFGLRSSIGIISDVNKLDFSYSSLVNGVELKKVKFERNGSVQSIEGDLYEYLNKKHSLIIWDVNDNISFVGYKDTKSWTVETQGDWNRYVETLVVKSKFLPKKYNRILTVDFNSGIKFSKDFYSLSDARDLKKVKINFSFKSNRFKTDREFSSTIHFNSEHKILKVFRN